MLHFSKDIFSHQHLVWSCIPVTDYLCRQREKFSVSTYSIFDTVLLENIIIINSHSHFYVKCTSLLANQDLLGWNMWTNFIQFHPISNFLFLVKMVTLLLVLEEADYLNFFQSRFMPVYRTKMALTTFLITLAGAE